MPFPAITAVLYATEIKIKAWKVVNKQQKPIWPSPTTSHLHLSKIEASVLFSLTTVVTIACFQMQVKLSLFHRCHLSDFYRSPRPRDLVDKKELKPCLHFFLYRFMSLIIISISYISLMLLANQCWHSVK